MADNTPSSGPMQVFDPAQFIRARAGELNAYLPAPPAVPAAQPLDLQNMVPGGVPQRKTEWRTLVENASKSEGFTPEAFDALANEFKTIKVMPYTSAKGMSEAQREAFIGGFDAQVTKDRQALFGNAPKAQSAATQEEQAKDDSGWGVTNFLKATLASLAATVPEAANTAGAVLGGLVSPDNILTRAENRVLSALSPDMAAAQRRRRERAAEGIWDALTDPTDKGLAAQLRGYADSTSRAGSVTGDVLGVLSLFLGNEAALARAPALARYLPRAAGALERLPGGQRLVQQIGKDSPALLRALPGAAVTGTEMSAGTARQNVERGDDVGEVLRQFGVDIPLNTALNVIPASLAGGIVRRGTTGAAAGLATGAVQRAVDAAVNPNNAPVSLQDYTTPEGWTEAGIGAAMGALFGARATPNRNRNGKKQSSGGSTQNPSQGSGGAGGAGAATPAAPNTQTASVGAWEAPAAAPMAEAPLSTLTDRLTQKLTERAPRFKRTAATIGDAQTLVAKAVEEARSLVGSSWDKLSNLQRMDMVEKTMEAMRKARGKKDALEGVPEAFTTFKTTTLAQAASAPATPAQTAPATADLGTNITDPTELLNLVARQAPPPDPGSVGAEYAERTGPLTAAEEAALKAIDSRIDTTGVAPQVARTILLRTGKVPTEQSNTGTKRSSGKKQEKAALAKSEPPKVSKEPAARTPAQQTKDYYSTLFNFAAGNENATFGGVTADQVRNDPNLPVIREGIASGQVTDAETMQGYLTNRGLKLDEQSPISKGEHDNRLVSKLLNARRKDAEPARVEARRLRDRGRQLGLTVNDIKGMTLGALRSNVADLEAQLGNKAPPKTPTKKPLKKTQPKETAPKTTKTPDQLKLHELEEALNEQTGNKERTAEVRKLKNQADQLESEIIGLLGVRAKELKKGGRTRAELRDMTVADLEKYRNELRADNADALAKREAEEKEARDKVKAAQEKQKSIKINRAHNDGMGDILNLSNSNTAGAIAPLSNDTVTALQKLFSQAVGDGKVSALRERLTNENVFGERIDSIIKAAKAAHESELGRLKDAVDADGKPLSKAAKSKILKAFLDHKAGDLSKTKFRSLVQGLTRDETGKGIETRLLELAAQEKAQLADRLKALEDRQKETPAPKPQAPKKGAQKKASAPSRKLSDNAKSLRTKIDEALGDAALTREQRTELDASIKIAQEGGTTELNTTLKDLVDVETITPEQAKALRALAQEPSSRPLEATKRSIDELLEGQDENIDGDLDPRQQVADQHKSRLDNDSSAINLLDPSPAGKLSRLIDAVWDKVEAGKLTPQEAEKQLAVLRADYDSQMQRKQLAETNTPERGVDAVRKKLRQFKAANAGNNRAARVVDFAMWLLDKNPSLADRVNLAFSPEMRLGAAGSMRVTGDSFSTRVLSVLLNADVGALRPTTAVHELMHVAERLMPEALQARIRGEYIGRMLNKIKQLKRNGRLAEIAYMRDVLAMHTAPSKETYEAALSHIIEGKVDKDEFYKYLNSSEYWAEESTAILGRRHRSEDSWLLQAREWVAEFIEHIKAVFGMDNNAEVYRGLRNVLSSDGTLRSDRGLREVAVNPDDFPDLDITEIDPNTQKELDENGIDTTSVKEEDEVYTRTDQEAATNNKKIRESLSEVGGKAVSWFQKVWENYAYAGYPLENAKVELAKNGVTLAFDVDPAEQLRLKDGRTSRNNEIDNHEVVRPVDEYLEANWRNFAGDKAEFIGKLNDFFGLTNLLERAHSAWLLNVKLQDGMDYNRANIIEDVMEGSITPQAGLTKLEALVKKHADSSESEYIEKYIPEIDEYRARLKDLDDDDGINQSSMAELNALMDDVRTRQRERLIESGQVDADDKWTQLYGWKWYVPLKGSSTVDATHTAQNSFDIIPSDKLALAKLNSQYKKMEGRGTEGERPFERLFVDLARSGERAANGQFMYSLYDLVTSHRKEFGTYVLSLTGNPRDGYTDAKGNAYAKVPSPKGGFGFIFNDGDTHHVVSLNAARKSGTNAASQLIRGLIVSNDIVRPTGALKAVARVTNTLARNYTTMHPGWQLYKGFVRDLTTIPMTMGIENFNGPVDAAEFGARFTKELGTSYGSVKVLIKQLASGMRDKSMFAAIDDLAKANPDSYAGWVKRYLDNGGSNAFTKGFELDSVTGNFTRSAKDKLRIAGNAENSAATRAAAAAGLALKPYTTWGEMTSNWAQFLELIPRVAAFKAYAETKSVSDAEAAVAVRRVMDYQQTGRYGRNINSILAFYRTGMTGADVIRRSLRTKDGKFDAAKASKWAATMGTFGYFAYQAIAAALGDDEDGIEAMRKLRPSTLTQYMVLPFRDEQGRPYGAAIGLGLPQLLLAPGALAAAVEAGHITEQEAIEELGKTQVRNATPLGRGATSLSITPLQPLVDLDRNRDSFDRPIFTQHEDSKKPRWQQGRANTAQEYKDIAKFLYNATDTATGGTAQLNVFPEEVRYIMSSYGGQLATDLMRKAFDAPTLEDAGIPDTNSLLTGRAVIKDADYYDIERIYRLGRQVERIERRINNISGGDKDAREQYLENNPSIAEALKAARELDKVRRTRDRDVKALREDNNSTVRRATLRKQYDSSLREASNKLERALDKL